MKLKQIKLFNLLWHLEHRHSTSKILETIVNSFTKIRGLEELTPAVKNNKRKVSFSIRNNLLKVNNTTVYDIGTGIGLPPIGDVLLSLKVSRTMTFSYSNYYSLKEKIKFIVLE